MNVDLPPLKSSVAPILENILSTFPIFALVAGTNEPDWAKITIKAFWRKKVDFPP